MYDEKPLPPDDRAAYKLKCTAYHEAGHAVAAIVHRHKLRLMSIDRSIHDGALGFCWVPPPTSFNPDGAKTAGQRMLIENMIIGTLAGGCAEMRFAGLPAHEGAASDYSLAVEYAGLIHFNNELIEHYLAYLQKCAEHFVGNDRNWIAITALANRLLEVPTMTGRHAKSVVLLSWAEAIEKRSGKKAKKAK